MSRGATARLFVAADPPAPVREQLAAWARSAAAALRAAGMGRPLRLLDPEALHLTLCFLGSRPVEEIAAIGSALGTCTADVGELSVGAPLWLPAARPRALAVAIHDRGEELVSLQAAVIEAIRDRTSWEPGRRRFRGHITVARRSGRAGGRLSTRKPAGEGRQLPATPDLHFTVESVTLYRSWLSSQGATYEAMAVREVSASEP